MRLCVNYPAGRGQLLLRTELDWELDVWPVRTSGTEAWFDVSLRGPSLALKPCLRQGDRLFWAVGANYVVSAHEPDRGVWPYFFGSPSGHVSDVLRVDYEGTSRAVRIYHPPGYDENTLRSFPTLYMQDGQNLFFPEEAFQGNEWHVDETMDRLDQMNAIRKVVVVGVSPGDRVRDYTKPGYETYARFLVERLKPLVDSNLRTLTGPLETAVMGSSLGGVAALHAAWAHSGVFGKVACLSSTFGQFDDLFERIAVEPKRALQIYLDSGWPKDNHDATNAMRDLLMSRGYQLGVDLLQFSFPEGQHGETSWGGRIHLPFQYFFGRAWLAQRAQATMAWPESEPRAR